MKFLRVIATLDPRHGGPAAGLRAITPALLELGHETVFASLDAPGDAPAILGAAPVYSLGPSRGGYAYAPRLEPWLRHHASEYDAVFVHGLWQHHGRAVRASLRGGATPYFVFPHGMLDPWFRRAYPLKHVKKWIYWQICERHILRDAAAVLFTCEGERRLARESFAPYACQERVVAYGTAAPTGEAQEQIDLWRKSVPELGVDPFWLFMGRIHPKKGVDLLLRAYSEIAAQSEHRLPTLVLAGPIQDEDYRASLEQISDRLPPSARVVWPGMLEGARKWGALRSAEAFVLPSHQENFGIAVVEALAVGTPVLISKKVNIWEEIVTGGAGLAEEDDFAGTLRLLQSWVTRFADQRAEMSRCAMTLFKQRYEISRVARSLVETIQPYVPIAKLISVA